VQITVNGEPRQLSDGTSLAELVAAISDRDRGIAVAVNSEVVPRSGWQGTEIADGDRVDVVTAVQGG
jgi:sulfur carrier protein